MVWVHLFRVAVLSAICPVFAEVHGIELGVGLGALEEGDDRMRGALVAQVGWQNEYASRLFYASREMGPVSEQTIILSAIKHWSIFKNKFLRADVGPVLMNERIVIGFSQAADQDYDRSENNFNIGGVVGLNLGIPTGKLLFETSWNSHIFPAGIAGIFLASGRKQTLSVTVGMRL